MLLTLPIRDVVPATPRARIVRLDLGGRSFAYAAGQAVLLGAHGQTARKPYSIAASPEDAGRDDCIELLLGVDQRGVAGPHVSLDPGELVDVDGPVGSFTFPAAPVEQQFIFIAGGTGIAPLRAMLRHALGLPHRNVGLLYSARTPDDFAYEQELRTLAREGHIELRQTITRAGGDDSWTGARGRIGRATLQPLVHDPATLCFVCGPHTLVNETTMLLQELGVPRTGIRIEEWSMST